MTRGELTSIPETLPRGGSPSDAADFEAMSRTGEDGSIYWSGRQFMASLGYTDWKRFKSEVVRRASAVLLSLDVPLEENIKEVGESEDRDLRLTRFACYIMAMNADGRKPEVARAQAYLAAVAEACADASREAEDVERIVIREEVSERKKSLTSTAKAHGVINYAFFKDSGYRGMYNMSSKQLKRYKGIAQNEVLFDFMGRQELAANLFRITQTEAKIHNENIRGQRPLESAAQEVGRTVRETMINLSGSAPEELEIADNIKKVRSELRQTSRGFIKRDRPASLPSPKGGA